MALKKTRKLKAKPTNKVSPSPKTPKPAKAPKAAPKKPRAKSSPSAKVKKGAGKGKSLIIVESPSKAKTINKYLGKHYKVLASVGHLKDLPKSRLGIDIDKGFKPEYTVIKGKAKILNEIKKAAETAEKIFLAPDPDREGEAIAWHIAEELNGHSDKIYRVLFNEITERAIKKALAEPSKLNQNKVDAQQARRVLDRVVGYKISPLLWEKVRRGLSAGRVQSVAVRIVCEREEARDAFVQEEYWSLTAKLEGKTPPPFEARLVQVDGLEAEIPNEKKASSLVKNLGSQSFQVKKIEKKNKNRNPPPPFITSKLQQEAAGKLRFSPKRTMMFAQQLYEGVEVGSEGPVGLITYMRTDSTRVAPEALDEVRQFINNRYGGEYLPEKPNVYKTKKKAQDAHEAIRPTSSLRTPETVRAHLNKDQFSLYKLIWDRFVASQMTPARFEMTRVDIEAGNGVFRANGQVVIFKGFTILYTESQDDKTVEKPGDKKTETEEGKILPALAEGQILNLLSLDPKQHFTQPPPRFTEALLIKELEDKGIGRPSTYHSILSVIVDRKYVDKEEGRLSPTDLGKVVNELLVQHFPDILSIEFTAQMETELDEIEEGEKPWVETIRQFYEPFSKQLAKAEKEMRDVKREEIPTDIVCEKCEKNMVIKWGRHGRFLACPGYPDCKNTKEFVEEAGKIRVVDKDEEVNETCEKCKNPMVLKRGRFGRFLACSKYPDCKFTKAIGTGVMCPEEDCTGRLVEKRTRKGKMFYACDQYPKCKHAIWSRPVPKPCPECKAPFLVQKYDKKSGARIACLNKECAYEEAESDQEVPAGPAGAGSST